MTEEVNNVSENNTDNSSAIDIDSLASKFSALIDEKLANFADAKKNTSVYEDVSREEKEKEAVKLNNLAIEKATETNFSLKKDANELGDIYSKIYDNYESQKNSFGGNKAVNNLIKRDFSKAFYEKQKENGFKYMLNTTKDKFNDYFSLSEDEQIKKANDIYSEIKTSLEYEKKKKSAFVTIQNNNIEDSYINKFVKASSWTKKFN